MDHCVSGKRCFPTKEVAEDVLLELWGKNDYRPGEAPIAVYQCDDCGNFHLTSREPMNERLAQAIADGKLNLQREAHRWSDKWKRR